MRSTLLSCALVISLIPPLAHLARAADQNPDADKLRKAVRKDTDGYLTLRYSGYLIKTDIDEAFAVDAALFLRQFCDAFRSFFKPEPKLKVTPVVYFFKDQAAYQDFVKKRGYDAILNAGGAFRGTATASELFTYHPRPGGGFKDFPVGLVQHEGAHQLLCYILGTLDVPVWYSEGVASFFESWNTGLSRDDNLTAFKATYSRFPTIAKTYGTKDFVGLHALMRLDYQTWSPDDFGPKTLQHYAEVQSFTTFLLVSDKGRQFFTEIFKAVAAGRDPAKILTWKTIDNAQKAWYKDIEERIERAKNPPADDPKNAPAPPAK